MELTVKICSCIVFLSSFYVNAFESKVVLSQLAELEASLAEASEKEGKLVALELERKRGDPGYQFQYANSRVVRAYHREADEAMRRIIEFKEDVLRSGLLANPGCADLMLAYRDESFNDLKDIYHNFRSRKVPFPLVSSLYGANEHDSLGFITKIVMSCGDLNV